MSTLSSVVRLSTPDAPATPSVSAAPGEFRINARHYVLVVEDDSGAAECMRCALEQMRVFDMISHDGEIGLKMAGVLNFDLIIVDVLMPRMNGFELCQAIRKTPVGRDVPVMFVSCVTDAQAQAQAAALGAAHYLCKPFELVEFQTHVERILTEQAQRPPKHR
jgi:DNA-binding response OmpR family regulator